MFFALVMSVLPGRIHRWLRRRRGQCIAESASLRFGSVIRCTSVEIGPDTSIGPFVLIRAHRFVLGERSLVRALTVLSSHEIVIGHDSGISPLTVVTGDASQPRSTLTMGDHSRIFPFCWLETGYGISIGSRVGIGGHGLLFTHGSWANYFHGAPVAFGPIRIEDRVWLPWRVFILPNVVVGEGAIIAAGSVVTKSVPSRALAGGVPAAVLRQDAYLAMDGEALRHRIAEVIEEFGGFCDISGLPRATFVAADPPDRSEVVHTQGALLFGVDLDQDMCQERRRSGTSCIDAAAEKAWLVEGEPVALAFSSFLTRYGVRLDLY